MQPHHLPYLFTTIGCYPPIVDSYDNPVMKFIYDKMDRVKENILLNVFLVPIYAYTDIICNLVYSYRYQFFIPLMGTNRD